ncbi:MAG: hypothetical protein HYU52_01925 [Acidobacteria bacterium]|nr:hypothetical protein [Acidobacteriota bacterium]
MRKFAILSFVLLMFSAPAFAAGCEGESHDGDHKAGCAMAEGKTCPMKGKKVVESSDVEMTGKVVCMHCDLHKEESCRKVFQSEKDQATFDICPMSDMKSVEAAGEKALVVVTAKLVKTDDGAMAIEIKSAKSAS